MLSAPRTPSWLEGAFTIFDRVPEFRETKAVPAGSRGISTGYLGLGSQRLCQQDLMASRPGT